MDTIQLKKFADRLGKMRIACLRLAARQEEAQKHLIPTIQKTINSLKNRFRTEGVSDIRMLHEMPIKKSVDDEYFYVMAIYGLMTSENPTGRCGVITIIARYFNEGDIVDVSIKLNLGSDPAVSIESGSPVGVVTKVINYVDKIDRVGKGFDYWVKTYVKKS